MTFKGRPDGRLCYKPALRSIVDAVAHSRSKLDGISLEAFEADLERRRIVERYVEIISEASRRLPDDLNYRADGRTTRASHW